MRRFLLTYCFQIIFFLGIPLDRQRSLSVTELMVRNKKMKNLILMTTIAFATGGLVGLAVYGYLSWFH
jgi:hypothetical protein